jgi:hypothetical protein
VQRTLAKSDGRFYVVLPTEGSLAWEWGRKLFVNKHYSATYGVDYVKLMKVIHCNTLKKILAACNDKFIMEKRDVFPFRFLPLIDINLIYTMAFKNKTDHPVS